MPWVSLSLSLPPSPSLSLCRESEWTRIQTTSAKKTLMLGQIKMATHNLYALVYKYLKKKIPPEEADQTLLQLDKVRRKLLPLHARVCNIMSLLRFKVLLKI